MSSYNELTNEILKLVAEEFEVSENEMRSKCKRIDLVDAKHTAIELMHKNGLYTPMIAKVFGVTPRAVNSCIANYNSRVTYNPFLRSRYSTIERKVKQMNCSAYC